MANDRERRGGRARGGNVPRFTLVGRRRLAEPVTVRPVNGSTTSVAATPTRRWRSTRSGPPAACTPRSTRSQPWPALYPSDAHADLAARARSLLVEYAATDADLRLPETADRRRRGAQRLIRLLTQPLTVVVTFGIVAVPARPPHQSGSFFDPGDDRRSVDCCHDRRPQGSERPPGGSRMFHVLHPSPREPGGGRLDGRLGVPGSRPAR